ncbi:hypothetical protein [Limnobacter litoralis]|uniref:Uncharacterized protein n=1 Tax=Limnobacter litoralis TaxID=481366 RepID=A0ABQ5YVI4_9BURK|nr:hypothetical protein [Limnobacter litoralis]GLR27251.1 hypothetical protein GCM10007875_23420 [Limnobacter litoralis]
MKTGLLIAITVMGLGMSIETYSAQPSTNDVAKTAESFISYNMKDPDSSKFRSVNVFRRAVCGEVNSKNSYGAYSGFTGFVVVFEHDDMKTLYGLVQGSTDYVSAGEPGYEKALFDVKKYTAHLAAQNNSYSSGTTINETEFEADSFFKDVKDTYCKN